MQLSCRRFLGGALGPSSWPLSWPGPSSPFLGAAFFTAAFLTGFFGAAFFAAAFFAGAFFAGAALAGAAFAGAALAGAALAAADFASPSSPVSSCGGASLGGRRGRRARTAEHAPASRDAVGLTRPRLRPLLHIRRLRTEHPGVLPRTRSRPVVVSGEAKGVKHYSGLL